MKPWRDAWALALMFLVGGQATAGTQDSGRIARSDALAMAGQLVGYVENYALAPLDEAEQARRKDALMRVVIDGDDADLDRETVYAAARRYLATVDSDGHTQLWTASDATTYATSTQGADAARADVARVVRVGSRDVLVLRPPQSTFADVPGERAYATNFSARITAALRSTQPCAVVVDLSDQKGGNAWPALALLGGLLTPANRARFEFRDGEHAPVVAAGNYFDFRRQIGPLPANPLAGLRTASIGVVMEPETASAGEMLAFALAGEPRARTFGRPSYGMTTANIVWQLAGDATVLVSVSRYAAEGAPAVRGPLKPDFPAADSETPGHSVQRAADWAVANSPLCRVSAGRGRQGR